MSDIDYIKDLLKKFEANINTDEAIEYLQEALAELACIDEKFADKKEIIFKKNATYTYRKIVGKLAVATISSGTASALELLRVINLMKSFKVSGFIDEPDFTATLWKIHEKIFNALHREYGYKIDETKKNKIYEKITEVAV